MLSSSPFKLSSPSGFIRVKKFCQLGLETRKLLGTRGLHKIGGMKERKKPWQLFFFSSLNNCQVFPQKNKNAARGSGFFRSGNVIGICKHAPQFFRRLSARTNGLLLSFLGPRKVCIGSQTLHSISLRADLAALTH